MPNTPTAKEQKAKYEMARFQAWIWFLHLLAILVLGFSLSPMIFFLVSVWRACAAFPLAVKVLFFSSSIAFGYFLFGLTLIALCVFTKNLFGFKIVPGLHSYHSWESLHWMAYNSMILLANSAFLDVLRLSPFQTLFYRWMGARVGNNVNINTGGLADLSLLDIGDNVTIGGGVALICHGAERGFLRLAPTRIGTGASIGLNSVIMPDCQIGDGASIAPCSYLPKGTHIPPRGAWGGNPVHDLRAARRQARDKLEFPEGS